MLKYYDRTAAKQSAEFSNITGAGRIFVHRLMNEEGQDMQQVSMTSVGIVGPLAWGDYIGASRVLTILKNLQDATGDPRYRPSPWTVRPTQRGQSLRQRRR